MEEGNSTVPSPSRRHSRSAQYLRARATSYNIYHDDKWKQWGQVKVKMSKLTLKSTISEVYQKLGRYGNIQRIDLVFNPKFNNKEAYIIFSPAPSTAFWMLYPQLNAFLFDEWKGSKPSVPHPLDEGVQLPEKVAQNAASLDFGFMKRDNEMVRMFSVPSYPTRPIKISLDLPQRMLSIKFDLSLQDGRHHLGFYQMQIRFDSLSNIFCGTEEDGRETLTIPLESSPQVYRQKDIQSTLTKEVAHWTEWDTWVRQTDIVFDHEMLRATAVSTRKEQALVDIGQWTTYKITFNKSRDRDAVSTLDQFRNVLQSYNVLMPERHIHMLPRVEFKVLELIDEPKIAANATDTKLLSELWGKEILPLSFETRYQLEVCLSQGYLQETTLSETFLRQLHKIDKEEQDLAVGLLEKVAELQYRFHDPMQVFGLEVNPSQILGTRKAPKQCTIARSALVTPTRVLFYSPIIELSNRVIREWSEQSELFLRVKFAEEVKFGRIMSFDGDKGDEVFARIKQALKNGIMMGDRKYEFLASGNSQFREHGAYFFAPTANVTCDFIRSRLGEFHPHEENMVAKVSARLGQNLSTTRNIPYKVSIREVEDIVNEKFCFTDGVGQISDFLAKLIAEEFGLPMGETPSAFQFRLGGCKGVLAVMPGLRTHEMQLRESQYKFAAIHDGLEIIRTSTYASAVLNRQLIAVLSTLGIPDYVFVAKMLKLLTALERAMTVESAAIRELKKSVDINQTTLTLAAMVEGGFMERRDPFTMSMLRLWRSWNLKYLKEKAKIPLKDGACLMGCIDETATLQGHVDALLDRINDDDDEKTRQANSCLLPQVFCMIEKDRKGIYTPVEGLCILARNPSLHVGDIRIVLAVDRPQLHHLKNVVVLPQTGDRDLSSMCSGGDLDGDEYLLIWDKQLIPRKWNIPPMDFTPPEAPKLNRKVETNDMIDFFVEYMKSDRLPAIAHLHMAYADMKEDGVQDEVCVRLAQMHSNAVDYPKSGVPVHLSQELWKNVRWPHFMEKRAKPSKIYRSQTVLGQLYDKVVKVNFLPVYTSPFDERILNAYDLDETVMEKAETIKGHYDSQIRKIMKQHDVDSEFEVWSSFIMKHNGTKRDYTIADEMGTLMRAVKSAFKKECKEECKEEAGATASGSYNPEKLHRFVAAMYTVTARQVQQAVEKQGFHLGEDVHADDLDLKRMPFMSFPWLFGNELGNITKASDAASDSDRSPTHARARRRAVNVNENTPTNENADDEMIPRAIFLQSLGNGTTKELVIREKWEKKRAREIEPDLEGGGSAEPDHSRVARTKRLAEHEMKTRATRNQPDVKMADVNNGRNTTRLTQGTVDEVFESLMNQYDFHVKVNNPDEVELDDEDMMSPEEVEDDEMISSEGVKDEEKIASSSSEAAVSLSVSREDASTLDMLGSMVE